ncbi:SGNH/GDSL hydrolase family protein [Tardiphaga sp. 866_E4_N2_1]|uniref:SGNH/GDSL hydrolase family protein n=1 Tax=unclassified Tardiphaga TaxID=2631404 RepID=UPI003F1E6031
MPVGFGGLNKGCAVFIGDSITRGERSGVTFAQAIPNLVGLAKGYVPSRNAGVGGEDSAAILARFEADCLAYGPSMVAIGTGHNDATNGVGATLFSANITEMVRKARIAGARVTLWVPVYAQDSTLNTSIAPYRTAMRSLISSLSCDGFDLYDDIVALDSATQNAMYIEPPGLGQHFSVAGNAWAAGKVGTGAYANSFLGA